MSDKNIIGLPKAEASELRKIIDNLIRAMPDQLELSTLLAKFDMNTYNAYLAAGFTEDQALDLLKASKIKASV